MSNTSSSTGRKRPKDYYTISKVVGHRETIGGVQYKVHWAGYSSSQDTWEPEESLQECQEFIQDYIMNNQTPKPRRSVRIAQRPPYTADHADIVIADDMEEETTVTKRQKRSKSKVKLDPPIVNAPSSPPKKDSPPVSQAQPLDSMYATPTSQSQHSMAVTEEDTPVVVPMNMPTTSSQEKMAEIEVESASLIMETAPTSPPHQKKARSKTDTPTATLSSPEKDDIAEAMAAMAQAMKADNPMASLIPKDPAPSYSLRVLREHIPKSNSYNAGANFSSDDEDEYMRKRMGTKSPTMGPPETRFRNQRNTSGTPSTSSSHSSKRSRNRDSRAHETTTKTPCFEEDDSISGGTPMEEVEEVMVITTGDDETIIPNKIGWKELALAGFLGGVGFIGYICYISEICIGC